MSHTDAYLETTEIATKKIVVAWLLLLALLIVPFLYKAASTVFQSSHVKKGEYATCYDIWGDQFNIAVKDVSNDNGILTLSILVNYSLVDKADENDKQQASAAIEVFLQESSYIHDGFNKVNCMDSSQGITSYTSPGDKTAVVNMKFKLDNEKGQTLVVRSYKSIDNLSETQIKEGLKKSTDPIIFEFE